MHLSELTEQKHIGWGYFFYSPTFHFLLIKTQRIKNRICYKNALPPMIMPYWSFKSKKDEDDVFMFSFWFKMISVSLCHFLLKKSATNFTILCSRVLRIESYQYITYKHTILVLFSTTCHQPLYCLLQYLCILCHAKSLKIFSFPFDWRFIISTIHSFFMNNHEFYFWISYGKP